MLDKSGVVNIHCNLYWFWGTDGLQEEGRSVYWGPIMCFLLTYTIELQPHKSWVWNSEKWRQAVHCWQSWQCGLVDKRASIAHCLGLNPRLQHSQDGSPGATYLNLCEFPHQQIRNSNGFHIICKMKENLIVVTLSVVWKNQWQIHIKELVDVWPVQEVSAVIIAVFRSAYVSYFSTHFLYTPSHSWPPCMLHWYVEIL